MAAGEEFAKEERRELRVAGGRLCLVVEREERPRLRLVGRPADIFFFP